MKIIIDTECKSLKINDQTEEKTIAYIPRKPLN